MLGSECGAACAMNDHAVERSWRHLGAMQFHTTLTAWISWRSVFAERLTDRLLRLIPHGLFCSRRGDQVSLSLMFS